MAKDLEYYLAQARRIAEHREAGAEKEIRKLYKAMLKDLNTFVSDTYVKYAQEDKLTFAMLQKAAYNARFLEEIDKRIGVSSPKAAKATRQLVRDTYKIAYDGMVDGVVKAGKGGLGKAFAENVAITPHQIKKAVQNPIMDVALEKNHKDILYDIKQTIAVGLMNGDRYTTMAKRISEKVDGAYYRSVRIARTEAHRVREAGNSDAAKEVDTELQNGTTGLRMVKKWRTMGDERVRPQRRRKGKGGWSTTMGKGANHINLNGQTVLADEDFDLLDGNTAPAPGQSGVAGHDINCRCIAITTMMTDAEFFAATGKHFPGWKDKEKKEEPEAPELTRKEMREQIAKDNSSIDQAKTRMRAVDRDIDKYNSTEFDDLKGLKKSDISGKIKAIEDREKEIDPIVHRLYDRPERGTPEYDAWRKWKLSIDHDSIIEEQIRLADEKAALQGQLRKFDRYDEWAKWKQEHPIAALQAKRASIAEEIKRLQDEIKGFEDLLKANPVLDLVDDLTDTGVVFKEVKKQAKQLAESEIISALAGGDMTNGSCASLGLAYMGQKGGMNVLDFRGGESQRFFSTTSNLQRISKLPGVKTIRETARSSVTAGNRLLKQVETGKEYYLVSGRHAAIVRRTEDGTLQYLELQSARRSGWHNFDGNPRYTLKNRFGECSGYDTESFMIDVDSFKDSDDLKQLLGYINTAENEQRNGGYGTIK